MYNPIHIQAPRICFIVWQDIRKLIDSQNQLIAADLIHYGSKQQSPLKDTP